MQRVTALLNHVNLWLPIILLLTAIYGFSHHANAAEVGSTVRIVNKLVANNLGANRNLKTGDTVFDRERIVAHTNAHAEIRLNNNSKIIVGHGSEIVLDEFVISERGAISGTLNVVKGAFRFLSGNSKKRGLKIKTPLRTIGIRGTIFDVYVRKGGITDIILFSGNINVCTKSNLSRIIKSPCDIIRVRSNARMISRSFLRSGDRKLENRDYNLISRQFRFPIGWQAPTAACTHRALIESGDTPDLDADPNQHSVPDSKPDPEPDYEEL